MSRGLVWVAVGLALLGVLLGGVYVLSRPHQPGAIQASLSVKPEIRRAFSARSGTRSWAATRPALRGPSGRASCRFRVTTGRIPSTALSGGITPATCRLRTVGISGSS